MSARQGRTNTVVSAIGLGIAFQLYGICLWGGSQLFQGILEDALVFVYVVTCLCGSLVGFLAKPLARLVHKKVDRLYRYGIYLSGILGMALLLLASWVGSVLLLFVAGLLVGFMIAALFMFWVENIAASTPKIARNIFVLSMVLSAVFNSLLYLIPHGYLLRIVCPVLCLVALAVCWLAHPPLGASHEATKSSASRMQFSSHDLSLSFQELLAPLACALALLLVVPTINYVALGDALAWRSKFLFIAAAQLLAAALLFLLLGRIKRGSLMVTAFIGAAPLLAVALFLFPFLSTDYRYALLLTGSFLHFIVTVLLMADCIKGATAKNVDCTILYGPCGALTFIVTYFAAQIMERIVKSGISQDLQMVATAFFLIYLIGVVFLFTYNRRRERERQQLVEDAGVATTLEQKNWRWSAGNRELECCRYIQQQHGLSERECEVLEKLLHGKNAPSIAEELVISPNTVRSHIKRLYRTLGVHSRQELIAHFEKLLNEFVL
ncbi:MAG: helix-turn-helix transcriptional regulator [Coriobacteriales bacterium]|jgi:DNA-binding CsgD family transcriptional regulator|nr:helix-turn-helix transcriptional regulator [Coriobacteriales bacterium]